MTLDAMTSIQKVMASAELASSMSVQDLEALIWRSQWKLKQARPEQLEPDGDWYIWLILAGRGWGKTRTGAEQVAWWAWRDKGTFNHVVAPTAGDLRRTIFEGPSGLLSVIPQGLIDSYNKSVFELRLTNGSSITGFSADEPDRLRGPQCHKAWCDELAAWRYPEAFDQLLFGLRLGADPKVIITTTPQPTPIIRELIKKDDTRVTRGSTFDNAANLAARTLARLREKYEGTRLGRQELYAEVLDNTQGALWTYEIMESSRIKVMPPREMIERIVVAVDPAVTATEESDETGIIVAAKLVDGTGVVISDDSLRASPSDWAREAIALYHKWMANYIVVEVNNGGDLVTNLLQRIDGRVPINPVRASVGKFARAEPIALLYEQGKIKHLGTLAKLESQMCTYVPGLSKKSPDRLDALVWALSELFPPEEEQETPVVFVALK